MGKDKRRRDDSSGSSLGSSESEDERSGRKEKRHRKEKKSKKSKKHKKDNKEKDSAIVKQAKAFLKQQLAGKGQPPLPPPAPSIVHPVTHVTDEMRISEDDYYRKASEFQAWLQEERRQFFNDLTTEETHKLFATDFVPAYNSGRLHPSYYKGEKEAPKKRTAHVWAFKGPAGGPADPKNMRLEQQLWRREQKELLDELVPKATGREALAEKRAARREEAKAREASPEAAYRVPGSRGGDILGPGADDSIEAARAREAKRMELQRARQVAQQDAATQKRAEYQAKEDERMAAFKSLLSQGPITIAKR